jgi:hypothetical protein
MLHKGAIWKLPVSMFYQEPSKNCYDIVTALCKAAILKVHSVFMLLHLKREMYCNFRWFLCLNLTSDLNSLFSCAGQLGFKNFKVENVLQRNAQMIHIFVLVLKVEPPPRTSDEHGFPHWLKKST